MVVTEPSDGRAPVPSRKRSPGPTVRSATGTTRTKGIHWNLHDPTAADKEYAQFPKLFHLDDYNECLARENGLYCVGTFFIKPLQEPDPIYELMKEYSRDVSNFNRTLFYRGYCVSARCPSLLNTANVSDSFDRCVAQYSKQQSLHTTLTELKYCRSHAEEYQQKINASVETPHRVFLYTILALLALNVFGTTYDVIKSDDANKSKILTSWSMVSNWSQLVCPYPDGDPRLASLLTIEGCRVIVMVVVIFGHANCIHNALFLANPQLVEQMADSWLSMMVRNGTAILQALFMISSFMFVHSLSDLKQINIKILLKHVGKRIFRITPVYILGIGFAATWWPLMNKGPLWHSTVDIESQVCRQKFWSHLFFFSNFYEINRHCLIPIWFLPVNMQLYILGCLILLCLNRVRRLALPILAIGFVLSTVLNFVLAYIYNYKPMLFVSGPENVRTIFSNDPSYHEFYLNPLSSVSSMMAGFFVAYLHHDLNNNGFKLADHKRVVYLCQMAFPVLVVWPLTGNYVKDFTSREFYAFYAAFERLLAILLSSMVLFGSFYGNTKKSIKSHLPGTSTTGFMKQLFRWRILYPMGRLSLAVLVLHWCVNMSIKASVLHPITRSFPELLSDTIMTIFFTYLLAIPVTLLIEIPFTKLYAAITSRQKQE